MQDRVALFSVFTPTNLVSSRIFTSHINKIRVIEDGCQHSHRKVCVNEQPDSPPLRVLYSLKPVFPNSFYLTPYILHSHNLPSLSVCLILLQNHNSLIIFLPFSFTLTYLNTYTTCFTLLIRNIVVFRQIKSCIYAKKNISRIEIQNP